MMRSSASFRKGLRFPLRHVVPLLLTTAALVTAAPSSAQSDLSGTIRFSWYGGQLRNDKIARMVELFEQRYQGTTISQEPMDWASYWERLGVQAAGNNLPCLMGMLPFNLADYADRGLLTDLQPLIDDGSINVENIVPALVDAGKWTDGKLVMLPYGAAPDTIALNASLAESNGIALLSEGYSWDDYFNWLRTSQASLPADTWAVDNPSNNPDLLLAYIGSHGFKAYDGEVLGFPKEVLTAWFTKWRDLSTAGIVVPPDMLSEEPSAHEMSYFAAGRVLASNRPANAQVALLAAVSARGSTDQLAAQLYPVGPAGVGDFVPVNSLSMSASCDNVPLAAAFLDFFLNDPDAAAIFASENGAVTNTKLLQAQIDNSDTPPAVRTLLEVFQAVSARGSVAQTFPSKFQSRFTEVHKRLIIQVMFGSLTPEEATDAFFAEAE